jgi:hypothetical protein
MESRAEKDVTEPVPCIAKVHHFRSRIAIPAPNRVNLVSGSRVKRLTFALRGATSRPWPRVGIYPQPIDFEAVKSQVRPSSALHVGLADQQPATCASFPGCPLQFLCRRD